ncbi:tautomerase family protein, partial [Klebsiella pneumoniae]|nr:tautomerase family protein [Klebsiella pneumoniae]
MVALWLSSQGVFAMPHVDIKCFPRELTDEQKTALAAD